MLRNARDVEIKGNTFDTFHNRRAIKVWGDGNIWIHNNEFYRNGGTCVAVRGGDGVLVEHNFVKDFRAMKPLDDWQLPEYRPSTSVYHANVFSAYGPGLSNYTLQGNRVENSRRASTIERVDGDIKILDNYFEGDGHGQNVTNWYRDYPYGDVEIRGNEILRSKNEHGRLTALSMVMREAKSFTVEDNILGNEPNDYGPENTYVPFDYISSPSVPTPEPDPVATVTPTATPLPTPTPRPPPAPSAFHLSISADTLEELIGKTIIALHELLEEQKNDD